MMSTTTTNTQQTQYTLVDITFKRLPSNAVPINYNIRIKPDLEHFTFSGTVQIQVQIKQRSPKIVLNSAELSIKSVKWHAGGFFQNCCHPIAPYVDFIADEEEELLTLYFDPPLGIGVGTVILRYSGIINDDLIGFYRSKYTTASGEEKYIVLTQFEATHARSCFPCFDEPALKATFDIVLVVPKDVIALSNMPLSQTHPSKHDNHKICTYKRSPRMSTYLVAFILLEESDYDFIEARSTDHKVLCRVYTTKDKIENGRFALNVCTKVLPFYKEYFGIPYALKKLDLVSIDDFPAGGMENWGLVFFREAALIASEETTSALGKQNVALVVGHELAHQWFGNLVTMEWWDGLFLKEGYASFLECMCVEYLYPEFNIWTQFVIQSHIVALEMDCLKTSHPIEVPVDNPAEIEQIFDDISYSKGAAIIRMLHRYIGDKDFKKGMQIYLSKYKFKNTKVADLWITLGKASSKPIFDVMSTWTRQKGFPLVKISSKQNGKSRVLQLTQERFCSYPGVKDEVSYVGGTLQQLKWKIPLTFSTSQDPSKIIKETLMTDFTCTVTIPNVTDSSVWIKLNPSFEGFYRVRYTTEMMKQFTPAIKDKTLPDLDRLSLLDDLFALVVAGEGTIIDVLNLLKAFENEDSYIVWSTVNNILHHVGVFSTYTDYYDVFKMFCHNLFSKIYKKLGWDDSAQHCHLESLLRSLVLTRMALVQHKPTMDEGLIRFTAYMAGKHSISPDLRSPLYKAALRHGDQTEYESILKKYRKSDQDEKNSIAKSLGTFLDPDILKQVLEFSISDDVRLADSYLIINSVAKMSRVGRELAWGFFKKNYRIFQDRCISGNAVGEVVKNITENFLSAEKAFEVEKFFREHPFQGAERAIQQSIENIRIHTAWLERDRHLFDEFCAPFVDKMFII